MKKLATKCFKYGVFMIMGVVFLSSCRKEVSSTTGWTVNNPKNGGFEVVPFFVARVINSVNFSFAG